MASDIIQFEVQGVHVDCPNVFYHLLEPLRYLREVEILYHGIPADYILFLKAGQDTTSLSPRHEQYSVRQLLSAS